MALKKGDRVEFFMSKEMADEPTYGVVFRGGKKPIVYLDGGAKSVTGLAGAFTLSDHPLPADEPSIMDRWSIKNYRDSGMGEETAHFQADIVLLGKVMIHVRNGGHGGCNLYQPVNGATWDSVHQFQADAKAWGKQFGYPYDFETEDTWVEWAAREKIWGKLAVNYFKEYPTVGFD